MNNGSDIPLLPPPTHINDTNKKWDVVIFITILLVITSIPAILRLVLRWKSKTFGLDDWTMNLALIFYLVHSIIAAYVNSNAGVGKPLWEVTMSEFELWGKGHVASCFLYPCAAGFTRISILFFYDRVFSKASKPMKMIIRGAILFIACYIAGFVTYAGFLCKPLNKFWKPFERAQYCGSNTGYWVYTAVLYGLSLFQDLLILFLPIWSVMGLQISLKKRIGVVIVFALGASACIAAAYKLTILGLQWTRTEDIDPRWAMTQASRVIPPQFDQYGHTMWNPTQAELSAAIIGSSMIALKPYLNNIMQKLSSILGHISISSGKSQTNNCSLDNSQCCGNNPNYFKMNEGSVIEVSTDIEMKYVSASV